jgi:hypothetical protein
MEIPGPEPVIGLAQAGPVGAVAQILCVFRCCSTELLDGSRHGSREAHMASLNLFYVWIDLLPAITKDVSRLRSLWSANQNGQAYNSANCFTACSGTAHAVQKTLIPDVLQFFVRILPS